MAFIPNKAPTELAKQLPPWLRTLLGADDPASQVTSMAQPMGMGPLGAVIKIPEQQVMKRVIPAVAAYTERDVAPFLKQTLGKGFEDFINKVMNKGTLQSVKEISSAPIRDTPEGIGTLASVEDGLRSAGLSRREASLAMDVAGNQGVYSPARESVSFFNQIEPWWVNKGMTSQSLLGHEVGHAGEEIFRRFAYPTDQTARAKLANILGGVYPWATNKEEATVEAISRLLTNTPMDIKENRLNEVFNLALRALNDYKNIQ
jgi:hypothetical protein